MGKRKFTKGEKVIGNDKKASFRGRRGIIISYGPHKGEYLVHFEDGKQEAVNVEWIDKQEADLWPKQKSRQYQMEILS